MSSSGDHLSDQEGDTLQEAEKKQFRATGLVMGCLRAETKGGKERSLAYLDRNKRCGIEE